MIDFIYDPYRGGAQYITFSIAAKRHKIHVKGHRDGPTKELTSDAMLTLVMTKEKDGWTIAAFQNTQIVPRQ